MELHDLNIENKPGGCRICVVEVQGRRNLAPSCSTNCENGMVVKTHTPRVLNARQDCYGIYPVGSSEGLPDLCKIRQLRPAKYGSYARYQGYSRC